MPWLLRAISDESQGTHRPDLIAPGAAAGDASYEPMIATEDMSQKITDALNWKKTSGNEVGFWSASLLFPLQMALYRAQKKQKNVRILCINTETARAMDGGPVQFDYMPKLKKEYGVELRNKDGTLQDHSEVWVTMACFVSGRDTRVAKLEDLERRGLYKLLPAMEGSWRSHHQRLNFPIQDMRSFHFQSQRALTNGHITVAAKMAASFKLFHGEIAESVPLQVFIPLLGLQKRAQNDPVLHQWLGQNCLPSIDQPFYHSVEVEEATLPEIAQADMLSTLFQGKRVSNTVLTSTACIAGVAVNREWQAWRCLRCDNRAARREAKDSNSISPSEGSAGRKQAKGSPKEGGARGDDRYQARPVRVWLPRPEYELRLALQNGQQEIGAETGDLLRTRKRVRDEVADDASGLLRGSDYRAKRQRRDFF